MSRNSRSLGSMTASQMFPSGLPSKRTPRQVVASFLRIAEGVAHRWIESRKGVLLLQMAPYEPKSGEIYIYDRQRDMWYLLSFEFSPNGFSVESFERVYREYRLLSYVEQPGLLQNLLQRPTAPMPTQAVVEQAASESLKHDLEMAGLMDLVNAGHSVEVSA